MARNFKKLICTWRKYLVCVCADSNSILLSKTSILKQTQLFIFTKKYIKLCVVSTPQLFFSSEKTSFPSSEDTTNQAKTFQDIYMKKKAPCATKILKSDTKKNGNHIFTCLFVQTFIRRSKVSICNTKVSNIYLYMANFKTPNRLSFSSRNMCTIFFGII